MSRATSGNGVLSSSMRSHVWPVVSMPAPLSIFLSVAITRPPMGASSFREGMIAASRCVGRLPGRNAQTTAPTKNRNRNSSIQLSPNWRRRL